MKRQISANIFLEKNEDAIHVEFIEAQDILSSAVLNGGFIRANHIVNLRVPEKIHSSEEPETTLSKYCHQQCWGGTSVGMMTAASMDSFRLMKETVNGIDILVLVTAGLSNARRAGDRAEYREISTQKTPLGTINILAICSVALTQAAMVEASITVTEAKAAALQDAGIMSPVSHKIATGTGTDSIAIVSSIGDKKVRYCGKHVLLGEILGRLTYEAVTSSISWYSTVHS